MIEQIVNWYDNLSMGQSSVIFLAICGILFMFWCDFYKSFKNKRKTTTQKYREGLIRK